MIRVDFFFARKHTIFRKFFFDSIVFIAIRKNKKTTQQQQKPTIANQSKAIRPLWQKRKSLQFLALE